VLTYLPYPDGGAATFLASGCHRGRSNTTKIQIELQEKNKFLNQLSTGAGEGWRSVDPIV
jgi:hypothetical protein